MPDKPLQPPAFVPLSTPPRTVQLAFDGLLHRDPRPWRTLPLDPVPRGEPPAGALDLVLDLIGEGWLPVVLTDRAFWGDGLAGVTRWLREHRFPKLAIRHQYREDCPLIATNVIGPSQVCTPFYRHGLLQVVAGLTEAPRGTDVEPGTPEPEASPCTPPAPKTAAKVKAAVGLAVEPLTSSVYGTEVEVRAEASCGTAGAGPTG